MIGKLRPVAGHAVAYLACETALACLRRVLGSDYADVEAVVIRAMIRCGIAEVGT